jgi:hypothetical protein
LINLFFSFVFKAFLSCDEEWAQHKKVIEITEKKPLQVAVPSHFPYLYVSWLSDTIDSRTAVTGYVHPVEDDSSVKHSFCFDILAGIMEEDPYRMRKGKPFSEAEEKDNVKEWSNHWKEYDWTQFFAEEE